MARSVSGRRLVAAFVWLHWRQLVNAVQARRRGLGAKIGAWAQVAVQVLLALAFLGLALGVSAGLALAGFSLSDAGTDPQGPLVALRFVLPLVVVMTLALAALRAGVSGTVGLERLLLLPLSGRVLHRLASVTYLADPWLLAMLPGLLILALFLVRLGAAAGAVALAAGLLFLLATGALASALAQGVRLLLRDRRRAEAVIALALLGFIAVSVAPGLMMALGRAKEEPAAPAEAPADAAPEAGAEGREAPPGEDAGSTAAPPARQSAALDALAERYPWPLQAVPSEAYVRALARATGGAPAAALPSLAALALVCAGAWTLSRLLWQRLATSPVAGGRRGRMRLPGWRGDGGGARAVAGAFVRVSLRTVQGKLALIAPAIAVAALSVMAEAGDESVAAWLAGPGLLVLAGFMALTVNQNALLNMMSADRSGLTLELLSPLTSGRLLRGRALGGAFLTAVSFAPALLACLLVTEGLPPWMPAASVLGLVAVYALFFPIAAWLSLLFPKASDLGKLGSEGKPQPAAALLGFVGIGAVLAVAGGVAVAGALVAGPAGALATEALLALVALALFPLLLSWTAAGLETRREAVYLAVRGS